MCRGCRWVVKPGWWAFTKLRCLTSYSCIIVTHEKMPAELPVHKRAEHILWSDTVTNQSGFAALSVGSKQNKWCKFVLYIYLFFLFLEGTPRWLYFDHQTCFVYQKCFIKISSEIRENKHIFMHFWCTRSISERLPKKKKHPIGNGQGYIIMCAWC